MKWNWMAACSLACLSLVACDNTPTPAASVEVANKGILSAALSDQGDYALIGSIFEGGSLWRLTDKERLYDWNHAKDERSTIESAAFSADGRWAATATTHTIVFWSLETGQAARFWNAPAEVLDIALTPTGDYALLGLVDSTAVMFDIKRGGIARTFRHDNRVRKVALSADGKIAITGSEDRTAIVWDVASGKALHTFNHAEEVQMVAITNDGSKALSAAKYDKAVIWDLAAGKALREVPLAGSMVKRGLRFTAARFSADGSQLLTGRPDQIVQLWRVDNMTLIKEWRLPKRDTLQPSGAAVMAVAFAEKHFVAVAANGFVHTLK
ncbi:hypothetical protein QWY82_03660 [Simiduia curdlanivorans]|uniref:WD40 repeat domain-containing protein n=1 Tax=Simiduia curdlanivorans TaxID=1492769 RepID=A0ABV8V0Q3_9GAMM|nr:hypothetical protein [Simiduia curdlanivorans]MDN3637899.1 hypothetical protein [Simiduia curdlanivorans]